MAGRFYDLFHSSQDLEWIQKLNWTAKKSLTPRSGHYFSPFCLTNGFSNDFRVSSSPWDYLKYWKEGDRITSPVLEILLDLLLSSASSHSLQSNQSGWLCIYLSTALILSIYHKHSQHISQILQGYQFAFQLMQNEMTNKESVIALKFHWSDHSTVLSLILSLLNGVTSSCSLTTLDQNHISSCLLEAFITSLVEIKDKFVPNVLFYAVPSVSPSCMTHYSGTVILDIPIPPLFPTTPLREIFVAVFESSIEIIANENLKIELQMSTAAPSDDAAPIASAKQAEYQMLRSMCEIIVNSKVQLLCCQKRIHPYLQQLLRRRGVVCLPRLSILHINKILAISGATQLGAFSTSIEVSESRMEVLQLSSLGYIDSLTVDLISGKKVFVFRSSPLDDLPPDAPLHNFLYVDKICSRRCLMSTVTVCGWQENQIKEIQQTSETILRSLTQLIQAGDNPMVLPGGGCWLQYLINYVLQELQKQQTKISTNASPILSVYDRRMLSGARSYCQTLQSAVQILDGFDSSTDSQFQLPLPSAKGIITFQSPQGRKTISSSNKSGVIIDESGEEMEPGYVLSSNSLDLYESSYRALQISLEIACCILEIDGVILEAEVEHDK
jgi:hypothetical protein